MRDFEFFAPTRVVFGRGAELKVGGLIRERGCGKALIHFGSRRVADSGLLGRVEKSLKDAGVDFVSLGGVVPNPRLSKVREGIALGREAGADFILAVGGGSVIDSSKAIAYGLANDCDVWDFYSGKARPRACLPVGAVLTIAAAGSEMSESSVITNEEGWLKRGCSSDLSRCAFAAMNPELTLSLPVYQTMCGCADIIMHTLERYFVRGGNSELLDSFAEGLVRTVMRAARTLCAAPGDYCARAEVMWAGAMSHNGVTGDRFIGDWACHQLEHELSGMFDVPHGAGLAAVWGSWARHVCPADPARFAKFAVNAMGCACDFRSAEKTAVEGISAMEGFFESVGLPTSISKLGLKLSDADIARLARKCSFEGTRTVGRFMPLDEAAMRAVYAGAR